MTRSVEATLFSTLFVWCDRQSVVFTPGLGVTPSREADWLLGGEITGFHSSGCSDHQAELLFLRPGIKYEKRKWNRGKIIILSYWLCWFLTSRIGRRTGSWAGPFAVWAACWARTAAPLGSGHADADHWRTQCWKFGNVLPYQKS